MGKSYSDNQNNGKAEANDNGSNNIHNEISNLSIEKSPNATINNFINNIDKNSLSMGFNCDEKCLFDKKKVLSLPLRVLAVFILVLLDFGCIEWSVDEWGAGDVKRALISFGVEFLTGGWYREPRFIIPILLFITVFIAIVFSLEVTFKLLINKRFGDLRCYGASVFRVQLHRCPECNNKMVLRYYADKGNVVECTQNPRQHYAQVNFPAKAQ